MNNICYLCGGNNIIEKDGKVRDKKDLKILECSHCGLIFLSSFDHIDVCYYDDSHQHDDPLEYRTPIEYSDDDNRRFDYCKLWIEGKNHLDFGCGEGGFILKAQDVASCSHGFELESVPRNNLRGKGIKVFSSFNEMKDFRKYYDIITIFHVLEHSPTPASLLGELGEYLSDDGHMFIEVPNGDDALLRLYKNYGFSRFYWSCHLFLFTQKTLTRYL